MNNIEIILTIVCTGFLFFTIKYYLPSYAGAKGTNQATKEDIGEITKIVENVKSDLQTQIEFLKAQLSYSNQHKMNIKNAEREAFIDYNKKISAWLYLSLRFDFSIYDIHNFRDLKLMNFEFSRRQYECDLSEAHIELFIQDSEFINLKRDLTVSILNLQSIVKKYIIKIHYEYDKCELESDFEPKNKALNRNNLREKLTEFTDEFRNVKENQYKIVLDFHIKTIKLINSRLRKLEEEDN